MSLEYFNVVSLGTVKSNKPNEFWTTVTFTALSNVFRVKWLFFWLLIVQILWPQFGRTDLDIRQHQHWLLSYRTILLYMISTILKTTHFDILWLTPWWFHPQIPFYLYAVCSRCNLYLFSIYLWLCSHLGGLYQKPFFSYCRVFEWVFFLGLFLSRFLHCLIFITADSVW